MAKRLIPKNDIARYLSVEDKEAFINDMLIAIERSKKEGNFAAIDECMEDWEDTVELLSIPDLKEKVWERFNKLACAGNNGK